MTGKPRTKTSVTPDDSVSSWYEQTHCSDCKAARLLHWEYKEELSFGSSDRPLNAVIVGDHWAVVHCDYFRRRVELPDQLTFCAAQRTE